MMRKQEAGTGGNVNHKDTSNGPRLSSAFVQFKSNPDGVGTCRSKGCTRSIERKQFSTPYETE